MYWGIFHLNELNFRYKLILKTTLNKLRLNLPWRILRPKLTTLNANGLVLYESMFKDESHEINPKVNHLSEHH